MPPMNDLRVELSFAGNRRLRRLPAACLEAQDVVQLVSRLSDGRRQNGKDKEEDGLGAGGRTTAGSLIDGNVNRRTPAPSQSTHDFYSTELPHFSPSFASSTGSPRARLSSQGCETANRDPHRTEVGRTGRPSFQLRKVSLEPIAISWEVLHDLGVVHYAFHVPGTGPRLKRLHVYVFRAEPEPVTFEPREEEGIQEVRWFPIDEARRLVPHPSLRPVLTRLAHLYKKDATNGR